MLENLKLNNPSPEVKELFSQNEWRQRIYIEDHIYTPGACCEYEWEFCHLPADLRNQTFLDVGANDGMFSFLAEKKKALSVTAVDIYVAEHNTGMSMTKGWPIHRISTLKKAKKSRIEVKNLSIYDLYQLDGKYDVVFCGNVVAWLQSPIAAIQQLALKAGKKLIMRDDISRWKGSPVLEFVNNRDMAGCMFNGNFEFYEKYLGFLGFKKVSFHKVDEFEIMKRRISQFPKYSIKKGARVHINPFENAPSGLVESDTVGSGLSRINDLIYFNLLGWISVKEVTEIHTEFLPRNPVRRFIFEGRYKKNMLNNYIIIAER